MGIRSVIEQVIIEKVGGHGTFSKNLNAFHEKGYISLVQRDVLDGALEAGHAVTHRMFNPTEQDLTILLDIVEGILAAIYVHPDEADFLSKRVPPRGSSAAAKKTRP